MAKKKEKITSTKERDIVSQIKRKATDSKAVTGTWATNLEKWHKMRMRIKKTKTFPFSGCANIRMPTIETKIRKLKAALINTIFGIRPVVQAVPSPSGKWETAQKIEKFLDHLIMDVIKLKPKAIISIDQALEKGFYLMKPYWKVDIISRIEKLSLDDISLQEGAWLFSPERKPEEVVMALRQKIEVDNSDWVASDNEKALQKAAGEVLSGKDKVDIVLQDVIFNFPDVSLCEPEKVYVPTDTGFDPQSARWLIHEFKMSIETVRLNGKVKNWDIGEIADIDYKVQNNTSHTSLGSLSDQKNIEIEKDTREGISQMERSGKLTIWEYYGYSDINGDGEEEKCVITIAPDFNKVLRKVALPFDSGKYPFVKIFYELTDDRWFSHRGIPELIEDIVKEIDIQHMQKIDQQTIRNAPMFVHRAGQINKNTVQFIFGQSIPVSGMNQLSDIIAPINNSNSNVEFSYEREQMMLETKVEELIGQVDFTLQSMINKRQPRTLGEVQMQQQNMNMVFSLDAELHRASFEELFNWIWELWCQYGDDDYEFAYFGKEGWEKIRLTREEVQGKYKITVRGNDQNTNPQVKIQKAQQIMLGVQNEIAIKMGVIQPIHVANAYKRFYQELDIPNYEELVATPEQVMQQQQQQQQQPPPDDIKLKGDDLTDAEKAQVLAKRGINPDAKGRELKSQAKIQEKETDQASKQTSQMKDLADIAATIGGEGGLGGE